MPVLHVAAEPDGAPDALIVALAAAVARALDLEPADVLVRRTEVRTLDGTGRPAPWTTVVIQGRDRGPEADRAVGAAIRRVWPDERLSVGVVRDVAD